MQYLLQPKRSDAVAPIDRRSNAGSVTWREYEQKFGNALDEDVKIGVFLALTPPSVQNHCHSNSHILKSNTHVSTMLFDCCRAQADVAASENMPMDLSMLGKGKKGKGDKQGQRR